MATHHGQTGLLNARHCSHCFQCFLASRVLAFFLSLFSRHILSCGCVGCTQSPESLTCVSSSGFLHLPPSHNSNYLGKIFDSSLSQHELFWENIYLSSLSQLLKISYKSFEFSSPHLFILFEQRSEIFTLSYSRALTRLEKTLRRVEHDLLTQSTRTRSRKPWLA